MFVTFFHVQLKHTMLFAMLWSLLRFHTSFELLINYIDEEICHAFCVSILVWSLNQFIALFSSSHPHIHVFSFVFSSISLLYKLCPCIVTILLSHCILFDQTSFVLTIAHFKKKNIIYYFYFDEMRISGKPTRHFPSFVPRVNWLVAILAA